MTINVTPQGLSSGLELQPGSRIALAILGGAIFYFVTDPASKAILVKLSQDPALRQRAVQVGQAVLSLIKPIS